MCVKRCINKNKKMRIVNKIVLHHSATRVEDLTWAQIREYHMKVKGWDDIGYHWGIIKDGPNFTIAQGRPEEPHC